METISTTTKSPISYGIPHAKWRPHQQEVLELLLRNHGIWMLSAPTGSGKTSWPTGISSNRKTLALTKTKLLQEFNYEKTYGFHAMYGKANYPCIHSEAKPNFTAEDCIAPKKCPCIYNTEKNKAIATRKGCMNYALWLSAEWPREMLLDALFLDEAHQLPDIVIDYAGIEITQETRKKWGFTEFPKHQSNSISMLLGGEENIGIEQTIYEWLSSNATMVEKEVRKLEGYIDDDSRMKRSRMKRMFNHLMSTADALGISKAGWHIMINNEKLVCRPLTARYHFKNYFVNSPLVVMMSATIGDPKTLAEELGLSEYQYKHIPNQWPKESRPILALDVPGMGQKAFKEKERFEKQADEIAHAILECPPDWEGVIHVTRKTEATYLARRLSKRGLGKRVWVPPGSGEKVVGTNQQMRAWANEKKRGKGKIAVAWSWWEGVDLKDERISICAKVPWANISDPYEYARMLNSGHMFHWRAAVQLHQGLGRTRRGNEGDYDLNGEKNGLVAIADGNWKRVRKYLDPDILESIIEM